MKTHLTSDEISAAVAGLELETPVGEHFAGCVVCRAKAADLERLIDARRAELHADEPDWGLQTRQIVDRLPAAGAGNARQRSLWLRPVLAIAAVLVMAVGIGALLPRSPAAPPVEDVAVEEILAEMDELLSGDSIPGFEIIDPELDDLETFFENGAS